MRERTLLQRLREPDRRDGGRDPLEASADSVLDHLRKMLSTRQGSALTVPDFGIPDLVALARGFPATRGELEESIRRSIEKYEPRLRDITVKTAESEDLLDLAFEITARIVVGDDEAGVWFLTRIDPDGHVAVTG